MTDVDALIEWLGEKGDVLLTGLPAVTAAQAIRAQQAEIARLKAALQQISRIGLGPDHGSAQWQIDTAREIATAAPLRVALPETMECGADKAEGRRN